MALIRIIVFQVRLHAFLLHLNLPHYRFVCVCVYCVFVRQFQNDSKQATIICVHSIRITNCIACKNIEQLYSCA